MYDGWTERNNPWIKNQLVSKKEILINMTLMLVENFETIKGLIISNKGWNGLQRVGH